MNAKALAKKVLRDAVPGSKEYMIASLVLQSCISK